MNNRRSAHTVHIPRTACNLFRSFLLILLAVCVSFSFGSYAPVLAETSAPPQRLKVPAEQEMRGMWIATVENINFPSKAGISAEKQRQELDDIVATAQKAKLNAIFFQVRCASDALYRSDLFPTSKWLTGEQGKANDGGFDPLEYLVRVAHAQNIQVHAWINPYRVTTGSAAAPQHDLNALSAKNPARLNPSYVIKYADGKMYYNPGMPEVRDLITSGVMEIVKNYAVDGIHFDDYFYPYPVNDAKGVKVPFADDEAFKKYGTGFADVAAFRRDSVNKLIKQVHDTIQGYDKGVRFGVAPFGIWQNKSASAPNGSATTGFNSYTELYSDPLAWIKEKSVDYICPQIYWSFGTKAAPFDILVRWWSSQVDGTGVDLYIGHATYKVPTDFQSAEEIPKQLQYARAYMGVAGSVYYGYDAIKTNSYNLIDRLNKAYSVPYSLTKPASTGSGVTVGRPLDGVYTTAGTIELCAGSDPAYPVYYNSEKVTRTKSGYFTLFASLKDGANQFVLTQNGKEYAHTVNKGTRPTTSKPYVYPRMDSYQINLVRPNNTMIVGPGEQVALRVQAPSGSTVTADFAGKTYTLKAQTLPPNEAPYMTEVYTATVTLPQGTSGNSLQNLGKVKYTATRANGEKATAESANISVIRSENKVVVQVTRDYSFLKTAVDSTFYNDYLNASEGMRDYITRLEGGYYKLRFGGYIAEEDVKLLDGIKLNENRVYAAKMENTTKYTELRFDVTENVPINAFCSDGKVYVTLYNTKPDIFKEMQLVDNPLFTAVKTTYSSANGTVSYELTLRSADNYYGFRAVYENGQIKLRYTNPQKYAGGDKPLTGKTIIVDAGHGGEETGAQGFLGSKGKCEEDLNLEIALELEKKLSSLGAKVVMTRKTDSTVSIYDRMDFLTATNPDMCISVHHNSLGDTTDNTRVRGLVALYCNPDGLLLAKNVSTAVAYGLDRAERNPAYQALAMCRNPRFPQMLIEMSFICNPDEYEFATRPDSPALSAEAISKGILGFYAAQGTYAQ